MRPDLESKVRGGRLAGPPVWPLPLQAANCDGFTLSMPVLGTADQARDLKWSSLYVYAPAMLMTKLTERVAD